jgi:hypothetical protein
MLSSIKSWLGGGAPFPEQASTPRRQPAARVAPHSAQESEYGRVVFKGRCLKDFPVSHLRRALKEDFQVHASSGALRGDLVRMLAEAVIAQEQPLASPMPDRRQLQEHEQQLHLSDRPSLPFASPSQKRNRELDAPSPEGLLAFAASPGAENELRPSKRAARDPPGAGYFGAPPLSSPTARPQDRPAPWSNPADGMLPPPARLPARQPASSARLPPSLYNRSPALSRTRPVWVPAAARSRPATDPYVSSAIAKRILETLGEVAQPFQVRRAVY